MYAYAALFESLLLLKAFTDPHQICCGDKLPNAVKFMGAVSRASHVGGAAPQLEAASIARLETMSEACPRGVNPHEWAAKPPMYQWAGKARPNLRGAAAHRRPGKSVLIGWRGHPYYGGRSLPH